MHFLAPVLQELSLESQRLWEWIRVCDAGVCGLHVGSWQGPSRFAERLVLKV